MKPQALSREPWASLFDIFIKADQVSETDLAQSIAALPLELPLKDGLIHAIGGDNRPLNRWLFDSIPQDNGLLAWIAPVIIEGGKRYAWMIGKRSELMPDVAQRFIMANKRAAADPLLLQRDLPPPLLFIRPLAVSTFRETRSPTDGEFAIFQTKYRAATAELDDFYQRMALNCDYLFEYRRNTLERARRIVTGNRKLGTISQSIPLYAMLHSEGHNQGHFLGPWPYHDGKRCVLGEALEEFRSCLASIRLVEYAGLSEREADEFAFLVFVVRFFGYGFDAFCLERQKRETAREVAVGLMFFETLVAKNVLQVANGHLVVPSLGQVRHCLVDTLKEIHIAEYTARKGGIESLRALATHWYTIAFPNQSYSNKALDVYKTMKHQCQKERSDNVFA